MSKAKVSQESSARVKSLDDSPNLTEVGEDMDAVLDRMDESLARIRERSRHIQDLGRRLTGASAPVFREVETDPDL